MASPPSTLPEDRCERALLVRRGIEEHGLFDDDYAENTPRIAEKVAAWAANLEFSMGGKLNAVPQPNKRVSDDLKERRKGLYDMLWPLLQATKQLRTAGTKRARNADRASRPDNASRVARPDNANRGPNWPSTPAVVVYTRI